MSITNIPSDRYQPLNLCMGHVQQHDMIFSFWPRWTKYWLSSIFNSSNLSVQVKKILSICLKASYRTRASTFPLGDLFHLTEVDTRANIRIRSNERNDKINCRLTRDIYLYKRWCNVIHLNSRYFVHHIKHKRHIFILC
jgi:hypothetical protein